MNEPQSVLSYNSVDVDGHTYPSSLVRGEVYHLSLEIDVYSCHLDVTVVTVITRMKDRNFQPEALPRCAASCCPLVKLRGAGTSPPHLCQRLDFPQTTMVAAPGRPHARLLPRNLEHQRCVKSRQLASGLEEIEWCCWQVLGKEGSCSFLTPSASSSTGQQLVQGLKDR